MSNMNTLVKPDDRFLRMTEVKVTTGLSRAHLYALISQGKFPKQVKLSEKAAGWLQSEVVSWMETRVSASRDLVT